MFYWFCMIIDKPTKSHFSGTLILSEALSSVGIRKDVMFPAQLYAQSFSVHISLLSIRLRTISFPQVSFISEPRFSNPHVSSPEASRTSKGLLNGIQFKQWCSFTCGGVVSKFIEIFPERSPAASRISHIVPPYAAVIISSGCWKIG